MIISNYLLCSVSSAARKSFSTIRRGLGRCVPCVNEQRRAIEINRSWDMRNVSLENDLNDERIGEFESEGSFDSLDEYLLLPAEREFDLAESGQIRGINNAVLSFGSLFIEGTLNLSGSTRIIGLPDNLQVGGDLVLKGCTNLTHLPENLQVGGDVYLEDCTRLSHLPENMRVEGDLSLVNCASLTCLPGNLQVGGILFLIECRSLTCLPEGLQLDGSLSLIGCSSLASLPEDLQVGGDLELVGCTQLTALPNWVSQLRARSDGNLRHVDLTNTGLSDAILERLSALNLPGVQFIFGYRAREYQEHGSLQEAILSWVSGDESATYDTESWHLNSQQRYQLKTFLSRLHQTADAQNRNTVGNLRHRVQAFLGHMNDNLRDYRAQALERISHGLESCDDRVILIMNHIELLMRVREAERADNPEAALRELGRGLLALEVVHRHAAAKCERTHFVDPIEVYLALEIHLNQELQLPLSTQNMLFERCAQLTDQEIDAARREALAAQGDSACVENFMNQWEPWQRHQRMVQSQGLSWEELLPSDQKFNDDDSCVISGYGLEELVDPVCVGNSLYGFAEFKNWWVEQGTNPVTRSSVLLSDVRRVFSPR